jgi:hypothetical protein
MQPLFISEEKLAKQAYRYDSRYRIAALVLMASVALQLPFAFLLYDQDRISKLEEQRQSLANDHKRQLVARLSGLRETEMQLDRIKAWEPILRSRMPTSAVIGAVEQTIPAEVVLSKIEFEATSYRAVAFESGVFRAPETYTITLVGETCAVGQQPWQHFVEDLLTKLPPGSSVLTSFVDKAENRESKCLHCKATLQAQANGNYFPLGASKIDAEANL